MKLMKDWKIDIANRRYSIILALSYIFLCVLSITCLFLIMFNWFFHYLQKEMYDMSIVQLNYTSSTVNKQLDYYQTILDNMFQEPNIKASLYSEQFDPKNELYISRYLNYTLSNDRCIDYCAIYQNGNIKQFVGPVYPSTEEQQKLVDYIKESYKENDMFYIMSDVDSQNRLFLFRMERDVFGEAPQRGVLFAINLDKLSNTLLSKNDGKYGYYVFDNEGNQILHQGFFHEELLETIWDNVKSEENSASGHEIKTDYGTYFMVVINDTDYELKFVQLMEISDTNKTLSDVLTLALISLFIIISICSILAIIMAYFIYNPLKQFFGKLTSCADLVDESKEYSDRLTQITSEKIISQITSISRQFHTDKVLGYLEDEPSDSAPPSILRILEHNENAILIYIGSKIGNISQKQHGTLFTLLKEALPDSISVEIFPEEKGSYCVFLLKENKKSDSLLKQRESLLSRLREHLQSMRETDGSLYLIISELIEEEEKFQTIFRYIRKVSKYVLFDGGEFICDSNDFLKKQNEDIPKKEFQPIFDVVRKGDDIEAKRLIVTLLKHIELYEINKIFHALSYFTTELEAINSQISSKTKEYQELYLSNYIKLTSLINQKQLYDYLGNIIEDVCLEIKTAQEGSLRTNMIDSIKYINENYQDPSLSLEHVADLFHISTSYFSRMFNEICDLTFPEYVNDLRLNHSTILLRNTNLNIKEISAQSGFSNVSYFSNQFKKKYAVSPSLYRNNHALKS